MILLLSPAKTIDFSIVKQIIEPTIPEFINESCFLIQYGKKLSVEDIMQLMSISRNLAELNYQRFQKFQINHNVNNSKPAVLAYMGDVYEGLKAWEFDKQEMEFAQQNLRILSGLYGILKPMDLIQPYRLEMGINFKTNVSKNLYEYWRELITKKIEEELNIQKTDTILNLASAEYYKVIDFKKLNIKVVSPQFKNLKNDKYIMVSFWVKKARGMMANYVIKNRISNISDINSFENKYYYNNSLSTEIEPVFTSEF